MKRDELKAFGLTDEQIEQVMSLHGRDTNASKAALDEQKGKVSALTTQLETLKNDLTAAQAGSATADELRQKLDKVTADLAHNQRMDKLRSAASKHKAQNVEQLIKLLDQDKITVSEAGEITGVDEQIEALKKGSPYLFADSPTPTGGAPAGENSETFDMNKFLRGR